MVMKGLALLALSAHGATAFTMAPAHHSTAGGARVSTIGMGVGRRAALLGAASLAVTAAPALADNSKSVSAAASFQSQGSAEGAPAEKYTPKLVVEAAGMSSTRVLIKMPSPGPNSNGDYVDCLWISDSKSGEVLAAQLFKPSGKPQTAQASAEASTQVEPSFAPRVPSGATIVPCAHAAKGGTFFGPPMTI